MATAGANDPLAAELKKLLEDEINSNKSHSSWTGHGTEIRSNQYSLTAKQKSDVNEVGKIHGCHTCNKHLEIDNDQPWIGDHFPPTELRGHALVVLKELSGDEMFTGNKQVLFPQCHACSSQQAALVKKLNRMTGNQIRQWLKNDEGELQSVLNLTSGWTSAKEAGTCIPSSGPTVSAIEGQRIQMIGIQMGCHSDPSHEVPALIYHADHYWPQEFCTAYMEKVMQELGLGDRIPDVVRVQKKNELRPQCPRCSGNQGGKLSIISKKALAFAKARNIPTYK